MFHQQSMWWYHNNLINNHNLIITYYTTDINNNIVGLLMIVIWNYYDIFRLLVRNSMIIIHHTFIRSGNEQLCALRVARPCVAVGFFVGRNGQSSPKWRFRRKNDGTFICYQMSYGFHGSWYMDCMGWYWICSGFMLIYDSQVGIWRITRIIAG